jgi:ribosomal protein L13
MLTAYLNMNLRRSQRKPVRKTVWEEKGAPFAAKDPKITKKNARTEPKTALEPIVTGPLPKTVELKNGQLLKLPTYNSPLKL